MRSLKPQFATVKCQHQVTVWRDVEAFRTLEVEFNLARVASGLYVKVVLQPALVSVKSQIYSRIYVAILHAGELRDVAPPPVWIIANKIVAVAGESVGPAHFGILPRPIELHFYN